MKPNNHVLVLNQNYEPLSICSARRAIVLLFLEKVHAVEKYEHSFHSVSMEIKCPSVIRLHSYVRKPFKEVVLSRKNIIKRDSNTCQYCGRNTRPMTVDHIKPKSDKGKDSWSNLICACVACNTKKGNRTPEQAGMKLLKQPRKPSHLFFLQTAFGNPHPSWKPYLFLS